MRNYWIAAIAALAVLGGCNSANNDTAKQQPAKPAIAPGNTITGKVTFHNDIPIAPGSKLDVKMVDANQPDIVIAEKVFDVGGTPPFSFSLDFDPSRISPQPTYIVNAILTDGPRRFLPALSSPVLTHGNGTTVEVVLKAEATPAEKLADECTSVEKHIGGLKVVDGTYTTEDASIGWDAFAKNGVVRYVRVNTIFDKGGKNSVNYAFNEGKPMCVKQPGGVKAKWNVGWDAAGQVVFSAKAGGGELTDAEIQALKDGAMKALQMAQARVDATRKK